MVSTSRSVPWNDLDVQPPHRQAANYYKAVAAHLGGQFEVTADHSPPYEPRPCHVVIDGNGCRFVSRAGETGGFGPADHLAVLCEHAPGLRIHTVLADARDHGPDQLAELRQVADAAGARLVVDDVARDDGTPRHDPAKLAAAYARIIEQGD